MDHEAKGLRGSSRSQMPPSAGAPAAPPARERVKVGDAGPQVSAPKQAQPPSQNNSTPSDLARRNRLWGGGPLDTAHQVGAARCTQPPPRSTAAATPTSGR